MSLFIKTHKNARNFSGSPGLSLLTIYNVISIILILSFSVQLVSLYIVDIDDYLAVFNLQSNNYNLFTLICIVAVLIIPLIFYITSLIFIFSINKSFHSIYLFRKGSVIYSIFALFCAILYVVFLTSHFFNSSTEYRGSIYFFLTTTICVLEFITYILYSVFGFSYNSFIKRVSLGITESNNDVDIFQPKPKNENYKPLNMWDESDKKKAKDFTPQNVFDQNNNQKSIPKEFDMWNESEPSPSPVEEVPFIKTAPVSISNDNINIQDNSIKTEPAVIKPNPVFNNANSTEPKHNKFEDWNDEVKSRLEHFDEDYSKTQKQVNAPVLNVSDSTADEKFAIPPVFTGDNDSLEDLHFQPETSYQPINYDNTEKPNVTPDVQVGAEFIPNNTSPKRSTNVPQNENFPSIELWDEPIMPKGRKRATAPQVIIDHSSKTITPNNTPTSAQPKKDNIDGNVYINTLWEAPIMNYGSSRIPRNPYAENPYVENQQSKADKKAKKKDKKNKQKSAYYQQPAPQPIICPNCRSVCSSDVYFCVKCGTILK